MRVTQNPSVAPTNGTEGEPVAFSCEPRSEYARRMAEEIHDEVMADPYRVPYQDDGMTHFVARVFRARQRAAGEGRGFRMSPLTVAELAGCTAPTITRRINFLLRHGLVRKLSKGGRDIGSPYWTWIGPLWEDAPEPAADPESIADFTMPFGKYRGRSLSWINAIDRPYIRWMACEAKCTTARICKAYIDATKDQPDGLSPKQMKQKLANEAFLASYRPFRPESKETAS